MANLLNVCCTVAVEKHVLLELEKVEVTFLCDLQGHVGPGVTKVVWNVNRLGNLVVLVDVTVTVVSVTSVEYGVVVMVVSREVVIVVYSVVGVLEVVAVVVEDGVDVVVDVLANANFINGLRSSSKKMLRAYRTRL